MKCLKCAGVTRTLETREDNLGVTLRRRRECTECKTRFSTFEINERLFSTIQAYLGPHVKGVRTQWALTERDKKIVERVMAGEKRYLLAEEYGVSLSTVSRATRLAGLAPKSRFNKKPAIKGKPLEKTV